MGSTAHNFTQIEWPDAFCLSIDNRDNVVVSDGFGVAKESGTCKFLSPSATNISERMEKRLSEEAGGRFLEVLGRHKQIINKVIRIYGVDSEDRRDLFQEIVYQLWRSFGSFKGESRISTWLYRVALNTAITSLRKTKKLPGHTELDDLSLHVSVSFDTPERSEQVQQLYSAIRSLGEVDRALVMLYLEELSYKEIAEVLGLTEDNVGVKLNRIKTKLRVLIGTN